MPSLTYTRIIDFGRVGCGLFPAFAGLGVLDTQAASFAARQVDARVSGSSPSPDRSLDRLQAASDRLTAVAAEAARMPAFTSGRGLQGVATCTGRAHALVIAQARSAVVITPPTRDQPAASARIAGAPPWPRPSLPEECRPDVPGERDVDGRLSAERKRA